MQRAADNPPKITMSYGKVATINGRPTPYFYGAGYGRDEELTTHADRAAELLAGLGLDVEKRGNSDGRSVGAHYDGNDGKYKVGLGAERKDGRITFTAIFGARLQDCDRILAEVPNHGGYRLDKESRERLRTIPLEKGEVRTASVYSPRFGTLEEAFEWLRKWGGKYCPSLQGEGRWRN